MKLTVFIILILLSAQIYGQPVEKIKQYLKSGDFNSLNGYIGNPPKSNVNFRWEVLRTIVGNYREGVVAVEEYVPANDGTGGSIINNYRINLLVNKGHIFYYRMTAFHDDQSLKLDKIDEGINSFIDRSEYLSFSNLFTQTFGDSINRNELFITSIVYGQHCGIAGTNPEYMDRMNSLISTNNLGEIKKWLTSPNAEKQLYAILGYKILGDHGYHLTRDEKRIISVVKQKEGMVKTCSGCMYMTGTFQDLVSEINLSSGDFLEPVNAGVLNAGLKSGSINNENKITNWEIVAMGVTLIAAVAYFFRLKKKSRGFN